MLMAVKHSSNGPLIVMT